MNAIRTSNPPEVVPTPQKPADRAERIDFLDVFRGIAVLAVFLYHSLDLAFGRVQLPWGTWFAQPKESSSFFLLLPVSFGWAGVAVFFVISGFCIHLNCQRNYRGGWKAFFIRRFFRIYPPYLVALLVIFFLFPGRYLETGPATDWTQLWSHALLIHNFGETWHYGVNASFWSIAVEAQLYLLYPLLLVLVSRFGWKRALIGLGVLEGALRLAQGFYFTFTGNHPQKWFLSWPLAFWFSWAIGAYVAELYLRKQVPVRRSYAALFAALACLVYFVKPLERLSFALFAVASAEMFISLLRSQSERLRQKPESFWLRHLGVAGAWSYTIYLWHQPVIWLLTSLPGSIFLPLKNHPMALFLVSLSLWPAIVFVTGGLYRLIEIPSIALGKTIERKVRSEVLPPVCAVVE